MPAEVQTVATQASHWAWLLNLISIPLLFGGLMMYLRQQKMVTDGADNHTASMAASAAVKKDTGRLVEQHKYPDEYGFGVERTNRMIKELHAVSGEQLAVSRELLDQSKRNSENLTKLVEEGHATTQESTVVNQALLDYLQKNARKT